MQNQTRLCLQTDRQTDRQTDDILKPVNPPLNFVMIGNFGYYGLSY